MIDCMKYLSIELSNLLIIFWIHECSLITYNSSLISENILAMLKYSRLFSIWYADLSYFCLQYTAHGFYFQSSAMALGIEYVQDFLIKLGIKPRMPLWEISIFILNHVIVGSTKIMNRANKNWAHFLKTK